jgi:hypothetical protein
MNIRWRIIINGCGFIIEKPQKVIIQDQTPNHPYWYRYVLLPCSIEKYIAEN